MRAGTVGGPVERRRVCETSNSLWERSKIPPGTARKRAAAFAMAVGALLLRDSLVVAGLVGAGACM